ncbi:hypothetical protein EUX98_g4862 [Antrodiella citrinella]|uniref:Uncharacterized protein n=1 Tax=Antrodiella citrinella TaxID=2447956 RepID=A0A4S4MVQ0_9APHY|nr:hypothetical protein EUX98_g4862 [Antrodiella citrinella]
MHLPEPIARPQTSDTIPSVITAQITSGPADSQSLDTEIAEAMEVDMSINMPGDQGPSEIGIFLESPSFSPPPGPSTHASASTSGALTPPDVLEDISSGGEQFPAQAVSSLFAPLEVPSSPTRSIRPVALESNDEDRYRLSMERFSTFDGHISVLRDPEGPASLPSLLSSETDYSHLGVDGSAPSRVEPDDATWSNITFDSPHAPSLFARLSASALSTGATEGSRRPDLSHADRELAPERVTSDAEPALPRHPFSISREPAPNEHGSEPLEPYDRMLLKSGVNNPEVHPIGCPMTLVIVK